MGGNAIKRTSPVLVENIQFFLPPMLKNFRDWEIVGSASSGSSGSYANDVDVIVDQEKLFKYWKNNSIYEIVSNLISCPCGTEIVINPGIGLVSFGAESLGKIHQVDIFVTDNLYFARNFFYADPKSKYKSAYRGDLLIAILDVLTRVELGENIWKRNTLDAKDGLCYAIQTNLGAKGEVVKTNKTLHKYRITKNWSEICQKAGLNSPGEDRSFETIWNKISTDPDFEPYFDKIRTRFMGMCMEKKRNIPIEILQNKHDQEYSYTTY
jgi:hypothetical protein